MVAQERTELTDDQLKKLEEGEMAIDEYRRLVTVKKDNGDGKSTKPGEGNGKPSGESTKTGEGDGQPGGKAAKPEDGEEKATTKTGDLAIKRRVAREQRKSERQKAQAKGEYEKRIEDLERENAELKAGKKPNQEDLLTAEPDPDDEKYKDNDDLFYKDMLKWESQGAKPADKKPEVVREKKTDAPKKTRADEQFEDFVSLIEDADEEGQLATKFEEMFDTGTIRLTEEMLAFLDDPQFPEEDAIKLATLFVDKPHLSKKVARCVRGTQAEELAALLTPQENSTESVTEQPSHWRPLRGTGRETKGKTAEDHAEAGDYQAFQKMRRDDLSTRRGGPRR